MSDNGAIVEMSKVSKVFGVIGALKEVDLTIYPGRIIGLLGANGAGKSTLLRTIIGLYLPDRGEVTTFGRNARDLGPHELARIGYVHQEGELLNWMTVGQLLRYVAAYYPNWNQDLERRYIDDFHVNTKARVGTLSPGERQKVAILIAIGFEPQLLILDEPASALDPIARADFLNLLLELIQTEGRTIIISSHILSDVQDVADRIGILSAGKMLKIGTLEELKRHFSVNDDIEIVLSHDGGTWSEIRGVPGVRSLDRVGQGVLLLRLLPDADPDLVSNEVLRRLVGTGHRIRSFKPLMPSLDELYMKYVAEGGAA